METENSYPAGRRLPTRGQSNDELRARARAGDKSAAAILRQRIRRYGGRASLEAYGVKI